MGKTQSKSVGLYRKRDYTEGECFVVNAHFNPLGIDDGEETLLKTKSTATSEITLSLNSCQSGDRVGFADDKYPLKVVLPPETAAVNGGVNGLESQCKGNGKWEPPTYDNSTGQNNEDKTNKSNSKMKNINGIQGFECDVSVEADFSGKQKREFVFTLYDLDGDGQITKDDITGLVRSMYEALGSSLKLPPSGSRTIRVRLTMSPGKKTSEKTTSSEKKKSPDCQMCQEKSNCLEKDVKRGSCDVKIEDDKGADEQENENGDEDGDEEEGETDEDDVRTPMQRNYLLSNCVRKTPHRSKRREVTTALTRSSGHRSKTHRSTQGHRSASPCGRRRTRISFSKEQQLLEIIQSNLEKKKGCGRCQGQTQRRSSNVDGTPRQHHLRRMRSDCARCECVVDNCQDGGRVCPYQINSTNGCSKLGETGNFQCQKPRQPQQHHQQHHTRSHSHDLTDHYQQQQVSEDNMNHLRVEDILLKDVRTVHEKIDWFGHFISQKKNPGVQQQHTRSKSFDPQCCKVACNLMTFTPACKIRLDSGFGYFSSHHHKHRHREEDHQRAMEQVACWIEKEHSGLRGTCIPPSEQQQPHAHHHHSHQEGNGEADVKSKFPVPVVERHEHHHIHQHYHHHYHHYHQL